MVGLVRTAQPDSYTPRFQSLFNNKTMSYKLNIQILNDNGEEVLDTRYSYESLDEMGNVEGLAYKIAESARNNEKSVEDFFNKDLTEKTNDELVFGGAMIK